MGTLDDYFPYPAFRPNQNEMLTFVQERARQGAISMIDAPTGSGKSSVLSALLAEASGRKVVVAVRTISQLNTFIRELELIRKKHPSLTFSYLVGKRKMCPMATTGDPYRLCEGLKGFTTALLRERAMKGSMIPATDPVVQKQIKKQDPEHPLICPYFVRSRIFIENAEGLKMVPSQTLRSKTAASLKKPVHPSALQDFCDGICPYEVMMQAARDADVILLNFHHLFNADIREQMYQMLGIEPGKALLLIDEAHNCGDTIQSIQSVTITRQMIDAASNELGSMKGKVSGSDAVRTIIPNILRFADSLERSFKAEDWFDPHMFARFVIGGTLYKSIQGLADDLECISEAVREKKIEAGDYRESAVERLYKFIDGMKAALSDDAYLSIYKKDHELGISLSVRNIDPSKTMQEVIEDHHATVLISGSLSPVEHYKHFYFGSMPAETLTLPNSFPKENRMLLCAGDITSAYSRRNDPENTAKIADYIKTFARLPGNLAVYFPSYDLMRTWTEHLPKRLSGKKVFIETNEAVQADRDLQEFILLPSQKKAGIIFGVCGGKWSEGLDYRGKQLSGACVIGLPLAPFNEVRQMINRYFKKKFGKEGEFIAYTLPAINKATQALGRVLRDPSDKGVLVLAEVRFLDGEVRTGLPPWMQEELITCDLKGFEDRVLGWK